MRTFETMPLSSESSAEDVAIELARIAPEARVENVEGVVFARGRKPEIQMCAEALSAAEFHITPWAEHNEPTFLACKVHGRNCLVVLGMDTRESFQA
jgi:hypothetical protein